MPLHQPACAATDDRPHADFLVVCLCAEWCTTCREYRSTFNALAEEFPGARFHWFDIEDQGDDLGDLDIENFPTVLIQRSESILFFGTMPPQLSHLRRMLESFSEQTAEQSRAYAASSAERLIWQQDDDIRHIGELYAHA